VGQKNIAQTLGWVSLSMSVGVLLAPLIGGVVYAKSGYLAVYYIGFALVALDILLRLLLIEKKIARQWGTAETTGREEVLEESEELDEKPAQVVLPDVSAPASVPHIKPASKYPPILTLLKSRRLLVALWGCIVQGSLMTAFDSVIPLYVQQIFNWNSTAAGLVFLALFTPSFAAPAVGWVSDHYGPRYLCVVGFILAIPFWILLRFVTHNTLEQKVLLCALLALIGLALALVMPPLMAEITYVVEAKEKAHPGRYGSNGAYAQAYGLFVTAFAAGTMIGPTWAGQVRDKAGWATMSWSLGLFSFAGAVPCLIWTGGLITKTNRKIWNERSIATDDPSPVLEPPDKAEAV
jgi:MFS family permease